MRRGVLRLGCLCCALLTLCGCGDFMAASDAKLNEWLYGVSSQAPETPAPAVVNPPVVVRGPEEESRAADLEEIDGQGELEAPGASPDSDLPTPSRELPPEFYPYREMLSPPEQAAYDLVLANLQQMKNKFEVPLTVTTDQIDRVVHAVFFDSPELFWLSPSYRYGYTPAGEITSLTFTFNQTAGDPEASLRNFRGAASRVLDGARKQARPVDKVKYIHDALLRNVEYSLSAPMNQSAYSALVNGSSVCAGYARAFQYLCQQLSIPAFYCVGAAGENHAWNIVKLDDGYYHIDVSWDDPVNNPRDSMHYEYFNLTDEEIAFDHTRDDLSVNLPACNGTKYGYDAVYGKPGQTTRKGGNPLALSDLGFSSADALPSLESYYDASRDALVEAGPGTHTVRLLLKDDGLRAQVYNAVQTRRWMEGFVTAAAKELGLGGYTVNIELSSESLEGGYVCLTQTVTLEET